MYLAKSTDNGAAQPRNLEDICPTFQIWKDKGYTKIRKVNIFI